MWHIEAAGRCVTLTGVRRCRKGISRSGNFVSLVCLPKVAGGGRLEKRIRVARIASILPSLMTAFHPSGHHRPIADINAEGQDVDSKKPGRGKWDCCWLYLH